MKRLTFLLASLLLVSCEDDGNEVRCPIVDPAAIPTEVQESLDQLFPNETVLGWCEGSEGFIAAFDDDELAMFSVDGTLVKQGNDDEFEDSEGCECEFGPDD